MSYVHYNLSVFFSKVIYIASTTVIIRIDINDKNGINDKNIQFGIKVGNDNKISHTLQMYKLKSATKCHMVIPMNEATNMT